MGELAPGPDYKLYLSPNYVETESDFNRLKGNMVQVGDVKTFDNFLVAVPPSIDPTKYNTVIVWWGDSSNVLKHFRLAFVSKDEYTVSLLNQYVNHCVKSKSPWQFKIFSNVSDARKCCMADG